jgi:mannose-6-phosphate isomerase-like protein (cupin superfamily)
MIKHALCTVMICAVISFYHNVWSNEMSIQHNSHIQEVVTVWQHFIEHNDWRTLVKTVVPKVTNNGAIYELPNYLNRPNESFAIADMRGLSISEPHYHPAPCIEIYVVLQGTATIFLGDKQHLVVTGDVVVIPSGVTHYTVPDDQFIMAIVNTPPYADASYIVVDRTHKISTLCQ